MTGYLASMIVTFYQGEAPVKISKSQRLWSTRSSKKDVQNTLPPKKNIDKWSSRYAGASYKSFLNNSLTAEVIT